MKYLLDTCIVSKHLRGHAGIYERLLQHDVCDICISIVTLIEIEYGLELKSGQLQDVRLAWGKFLDSVHVIPLYYQEGKQAAQIRTYLHKKGTIIGQYDVLIASTALAHNMVCVTNNKREFERVPNLIVEDWSI